jgi:hypothetical protein
MGAYLWDGEDGGRNTIENWTGGIASSTTADATLATSGTYIVTLEAGQSYTVDSVALSDGNALALLVNAGPIVLVPLHPVFSNSPALTMAAVPLAPMPYPFSFNTSYGDGVQAHEPLAIEYYQKSIAQNWWEAELRLGLDYELGNGVPRSRTEAIALLNRAANDGQDALSQNIAAMLERPDTPQFANLDRLTAYLVMLWGHAPSDAGVGDGAGAQYEQNTGGGIRSQCNGSYQGRGCGYGAMMCGEDNRGGESGGGSDDGDN